MIFIVFGPGNIITLPMPDNDRPKYFQFNMVLSCHFPSLSTGAYLRSLSVALTRLFYLIDLGWLSMTRISTETQIIRYPPIVCIPTDSPQNMAAPRPAVSGSASSSAEIRPA